MGSEAQEIITGLKSEVATLRTSLAAALERERRLRESGQRVLKWYVLALAGWHPEEGRPVDADFALMSLRAVLSIEIDEPLPISSREQQLVEALEGCWARLKTDRELVEKHAGLGKVYDGLVEDAESALAVARAVGGKA